MIKHPDRIGEFGIPQTYKPLRDCMEKLGHVTNMGTNFPLALISFDVATARLMTVAVSIVVLFAELSALKIPLR